ncbi:hypothetical protein HPB50_027988 [Hyalomma asiaticum]|nr:hypothetical protein HPB50_027988 [Hyalomma asiaticum]
MKIEEAVDTNREPYADESGRQVGLVTVVKVPSWTVTALFGAVCALLLVVVLVYCGVHFLDTPVTTEQQHQTSECKNAPCSDFAVTLRASMSPAVRPCDDFYGHVCGSWDAKRADTVKVALLQRVFHAVNNLSRKVTVAVHSSQTAVQKAAVAFQACEDLVAKNKSSMDAVATHACGSWSLRSTSLDRPSRHGESFLRAGNPLAHGTSHRFQAREKGLPAGHSSEYVGEKAFCSQVSSSATGS